MSWCRFAHAGFERRGLARALLLIGAAGVTLTALAAPDAAPLFGFSAAQSLQERGIEQRFDAALHAEQLRAWLKTLSAEPNHVGSPHDKANAEMVRDLFKQLGLGCADRDLRGALSDAEGPDAGAGRRPPSSSPASRSRRSRATRPRRARDGLAALQRLRRRRRCHRRARLRQLRHAGGLQGPRAPRHRRARARSSSPATAAAGAD